MPLLAALVLLLALPATGSAQGSSSIRARARVIDAAPGYQALAAVRTLRSGSDTGPGNSMGLAIVTGQRRRPMPDRPRSVAAYEISFLRN